MTLEQLYFPTNMRNSSHFGIARNTAYVPFLKSIYLAYIAIRALAFAVRDIKYSRSVAYFIAEVKDNYIGSMSIYLWQLENWNQYLGIYRTMSANKKSYLKELKKNPKKLTSQEIIDICDKALSDISQKKSLQSV